MSAAPLALITPSAAPKTASPSSIQPRPSGPPAWGQRPTRAWNWPPSLKIEISGTTGYRSYFTHQERNNAELTVEAVQVVFVAPERADALRVARRDSWGRDGPAGRRVGRHRGGGRVR